MIKTSKVHDLRMELLWTKAHLQVLLDHSYLHKILNIDNTDKISGLKSKIKKIESSSKYSEAEPYGA